MRLSFKRDERITGLAGIARPWRGSAIKRNGKVVGQIFPPDARPTRSDYVIAVRVSRVPDEKNSCHWQWRTLSLKHKTDADARAWVKAHWKRINEELDLVEEQE